VCLYVYVELHVVYNPNGNGANSAQSEWQWSEHVQLAHVAQRGTSLYLGVSSRV
jgi:hypothetical protein